MGNWLQTSQFIHKWHVTYYLKTKNSQWLVFPRKGRRYCLSIKFGEEQGGSRITWGVCPRSLSLNSSVRKDSEVNTIKPSVPHSLSKKLPLGTESYFEPVASDSTAWSPVVESQQPTCVDSKHSTCLGEDPRQRRLNTSSKDPKLLSWINSQLDSYPSHCSTGLGGRRFSVLWFKSQAPLGSSMSEHLRELCARGSRGLSEQREQETSILPFHHQILSSTPLPQGRAPPLDRSAGTAPRLLLGHTQMSTKGGSIFISLDK